MPSGSKFAGYASKEAAKAACSKRARNCCNGAESTSYRFHFKGDPEKIMCRDCYGSEDADKKKQDEMSAKSPLRPSSAASQAAKRPAPSPPRSPVGANDDENRSPQSRGGADAAKKKAKVSAATEEVRSLKQQVREQGETIATHETTITSLKQTLESTESKLKNAMQLAELQGETINKQTLALKAKADRGSIAMIAQVTSMMDTMQVKNAVATLASFSAPQPSP
jgi:hypothetical protein